MPVLSFTHEDKEYRISFALGLSLLEILNSTDTTIFSACGGLGTCGLCFVRIENGTINPATSNEKKHISDEQLQNGLRLACQVRPKGDIGITIQNPRGQPLWTNLPDNEVVLQNSPLHIVPTLTPNKDTYGAAVDLGTTHIRISLWDMGKYQRLSGRFGFNPQFRFGADVLTRLMAASESDENTRMISNLAIDAVGDAMRDIVMRESLKIHRIRQIEIVGNTAMLALFTGINYHLLLQPEYWTRMIDCQPKDTRSYALSWGLEENVAIKINQPLAGFVGSDLLVGVLATQLDQGPSGSLLIDFGTNSEIALWDGTTLWVTATAGGPAFEGCGITCGMPAESGAIYSAELHNDTSEFLYNVIGENEAKGVCGSGLVDVIACLVKYGIIKRHGIFSQNIGSDGYQILTENATIKLNQSDVDAFQRAKAAIGAGIKCLMMKAGLSLKDLQRICVCGAFGQYINIQNAQNIGLLPTISSENIELCGNTALAGCELLLLSQDSKISLATVKNKSRVINMSQIPEFENLYIENLYLRPIHME
ncbi:MAG: ferredoxin [Anaerolinea sp.]|nr:ferredoxin [Anaerolinea sp.]